MAEIVGVLRPLRPDADRREGSTRQHAAQDVHHHGEAVALVARHFRRAAERRQPALRAVADGVPGMAGIAHRLTLAVQHPAGRQRLVLQVIDLDLVRRDRAGRHVEAEGAVAFGGCGEGDGIGAKHGHRAARRHHADGARRAGHQADQPRFGGHRRIVSGRAEMVRVAHRHHADASHLRLGHRHRHAEDRGRMAQPRIGIDQRGDRVLADDARARGEVQLPLPA